MKIVMMWKGSSASVPDKGTHTEESSLQAPHPPLSKVKEIFQTGIYIF